MSDPDTALLSIDDDELAERAKSELKALRKRVVELEADLGTRFIVSGGEILEIGGATSDDEIETLSTKTFDPKTNLL